MSPMLPRAYSDTRLRVYYKGTKAAESSEFKRGAEIAQSFFKRRPEHGTISPQKPLNESGLGASLLETPQKLF